MRKEVEIGGKWYWELEATDQNQKFSPPETCYTWDSIPDDGLNLAVKRLRFIFSSPEKFPFVTNRLSEGSDYKFVGYKHCALLSSEHEKKSRRCTDFELNRWLSKGNGFWIDDCGTMRIKSDTTYDKRNDPSGKRLVSICTWDGEPMEPTAKNMGLEE
jgi:hypothetical protein